MVVVGGGAVEVGWIDARRVGQEGARGVGRGIARQANRGDAAVGDVVLGDVQEVEVNGGRRAEPERKRRRDAPTIILHVVAAGNAALLSHHVQAERRVLACGFIPVRRDASQVGAAIAERCIHAILEAWLLADHVDRAGWRGAPVHGAVGALDHFDLLGVEHVARNRTKVAHAVDEDASGRVETAHVHGVACRGAAVLADIEGADAGTVAQRVSQRGRALLLDDLLADDVDGLRRVQQ